MKTKVLVLLSCLVSSSPLFADDLATVLGSPTNEWKITGKVEVANADGRGVTTSARGVVQLTRLVRNTGDTEVSFQVRFVPVQQRTVALHAIAGLGTPDEAGQNPSLLTLSMPAGTEPSHLNWSFPPSSGEKRSISGLYVLRTPAKLNPKWPELVRAKIEADNASVPSPTNRWLVVRYILRKNNVQIWLDDRLLHEITGEDAHSDGHFRVGFGEGIQLASIQFRSLSSGNPRFETVQVDAYLNGSRPESKSIKPGETKVGDVPFVVPAPSARGMNLIDLGRSWFRVGLLEGDFDSRAEPARWFGALSGEPGRIQFRVPNARYSKLHLLASYDGARDTVPVVSVQFYKPTAGFPINFSTRVEKGKPHLVTIPLDPDPNGWFSDSDTLEFELTKEVHVYRSFPDPIQYSEHAGGLPSGVHVYAITLERPAVDVELQPDRLAHIWTAPATPGYTVKLTNQTSEPRSMNLEFSTDSHDHLEKTSTKKTVTLAANALQTVQFSVPLKRYGYHDVKLRMEDRDGVRTEERSLAFLHPDTRERGGWEEGKGPLFGFWDWNGAHGTMTGIPRLEVMVQAGAESGFVSFNHSGYTNEHAFLEKHGMLTTFLFHYRGWNAKQFGCEFDATKPDEMKAKVIEFIKNSADSKPSAINRPELALFWAEPLIGPVSYRSIPEYYGDPPYEMTDKEKEKYKTFLDQFLIIGGAIHENWPNVKLLLPYGIPLFPVPFLRNSPEATALMDGPALDMITFERLPEMQIHQVTFSSVLWQLKQEWLKHSKKPWPKFTAVEGPCASPATPGAITRQEEADLSVRDFLIQAAYGTTRHLGFPTPSRCSGGWGETHYGSGLLERLPLLTPKPFYCSYATMTRQLNRMNFVKTIETGNTTVFCLQFQHYKTGELLHIFWTLRGTRMVTLDASSVTVGDAMDNETALDVKDGKATFIVSASPVYVRGLKGDAKVASLGAPDHSDSKPAPGALKLANLGDGSWKISTETDEDYETSHIEFVKRFPGKMTIQSVAADKAQGGKVLAVHLDKQEKERKTMPFYTTLVPAKPIVIPGTASHLGIWARAAGDWGRVVYCLRDAKGERWLSVGKNEEWNVDDVHCWSAFNYDGWRYLDFELPGNEPWDCYRIAGSSFWGYYGKGDGVVDYPLTLEKIMVERRTHVIQVDELKPANPEDVLLGDLYAEYEKPSDKTQEAVRQSQLRMITVGNDSSSKQKTSAPENPFH